MNLLQRAFFLVKHKTSCSCESAIYFNLETHIIKENCNFKFYFNKTDITPTILDGGNEIVLAFAMSIMTSQSKFLVTPMF